MITIPTIGPAQFIFTAVTGSSLGKHNHIMMNSPYTEAAPLTQMPNRPSDHAVFSTCSPARRWRKMKMHGIVYEMYSASVASERMATNAVSEPIGMRSSSIVTKVVTASVRRGVLRLG